MRVATPSPAIPAGTPARPDNGLLSRAGCQGCEGRPSLTSMPSRDLVWIRWPHLLAVLAFALPAELPAAPTPPPTPEISEAVAGKLAGLRALTDAKNFPAALALLEPLLAAAPADSYDLAVLSQIKAQIILNQNGPAAAAIAPLETALRLGDTRGFLDARQTREVLYLLAQLDYEQAAASSLAAAQHAGFTRAATAIRRWLGLTPAPTEDALLLAASIFYNEATSAGDPPDAALLRDVIATAQNALTLSAAPGETGYSLLLAADQQLGETRPAADLLELLVQRHPDNRDYWQQLQAAYLTLAAGTIDPRESQRCSLRALLTLERAQSRGLLKSPADNFTLAGLTFNLHQPDRALTLLESGLRDGTIPADHRAWELLVDAAQQSHQEDRAIAALQAAATRQPADAHIEYALGRLCYALDRPAAAREHLQAAVATAGLDRPGQARLLLAYLNYELHQPADAARWLEEAARFPDAPADDLARLRRALAPASATPAVGTTTGLPTP